MPINSSSILVLWSPAFLWPGSPIDYFIIKITNVTDSSTSNFTINTNIGDTTVSFVKTIDEYQRQLCTELLIEISVVSRYGNNYGLSYTKFSITGRYYTGEKI